MSSIRREVSMSAVGRRLSSVFFCSGILTLERRPLDRAANATQLAHACKRDAPPHLSVLADGFAPRSMVRHPTGGCVSSVC
jgi:hypothetical protein